jgi:pentatricopeptide repeat protein
LLQHVADAETYLALMAALGGAGRWHLVLELLADLHRHRLRITAPMAALCIHAARQSGEFAQAFHIHSMMQAANLPMDTRTYNLLFSVVRGIRTIK